MSKIRWFNYNEEKSKTDIYASNEELLNLSPTDFIKELDLAWFNFFVQDAKNGRVLIFNTYNQDFKKIRLLHLTPSFKEILKAGKIFSSGGGLGAAIYCSPLHLDNTVHNIFEQYFYFQLPKNTKRKINILCIEVMLNKEDLNNVENWGVDYTNFGSLQCETWEKLRDKIDFSFVYELERKVYNQIVDDRDALNIFINYRLNDVSATEFIELYNKIFIKIPSLRFVLYEVLAEYILLYQDNKESQEYSLKGELYNLPHKKFIADLCPTMLKKFNMIDFFISLEKIIEYFTNSSIFKQFNKIHFLEFIKWRVGFYLKKIAILPIKKKYRDFNELMVGYPSLIGQVIYREFYDKNLFERERAKIIYQLWKKENVVCPIYSILPKGEVGINPHLNELNVNYKIFKATFNPVTKKIKLLNELRIKLESEIVPKSKSTVR